MSHVEFLSAPDMNGRGVGSPEAYRVAEYVASELKSYGLTPQDIVRAVANENQTIPGGNIKQGLTDYLIRVPGEFKPEELR